ncbi:MAG: hypothetical protein GYA60_01755 [Candidatus Methanofastidiosa archaeon]|jgi:hypothetical protein|nr:hypothetical protein [Candidatus Methanofastidiosa archaeon]
MKVFDTLNQLWIEKELKDLVIGDLIKHEDEQTAIVEKIAIDSKNTVVVYLKPQAKGE